MTTSVHLDQPAARMGTHRRGHWSITTLLSISMRLTLNAQMVSLLNGWSVLPAKLAGLLLLVGGRHVDHRARPRRGEVRQPFAGLTRWGTGMPAFLLVIAVLAILTLAVAAVPGTLDHPAAGWRQVVLLYLLILVFGAVTANLCERRFGAGPPAV